MNEKCNGFSLKERKPCPFQMRSDTERRKDNGNGFCKNHEYMSKLKDLDKIWFCIVCQKFHDDGELCQKYEARKQRDKDARAAKRKEKEAERLEHIEKKKIEVSEKKKAERRNKLRCYGLIGPTMKPCSYSETSDTMRHKKGEGFCGNHQYFVKLIDLSKLRYCAHCYKVTNDDGKPCIICKENYKINMEKNKQLPEEEQQKLKDKKIENKCKACIALKSKKLRSIVKNGLCKKHGYMKDYTDEMIDNLKVCSQCDLAFYHDKFKTCEMCRGEVVREGFKARKKQAKKDVPVCKGVTENNTPCPYSGTNEYNDKLYCMKHYKVELEKDERKDKKICTKHGCHNEIPKDDPHTTCEECRAKDSIESKERRDKRKEENKQLIESKSDTLKCIKCGKLKDIKYFINGHGKIGDRCIDCLEKYIWLMKGVQ